MKILVTGATGFLGRSVVVSAAERGHEVLALARPGRDISTMPWDGLDGVQVARADLRNRRAVSEVVAGVDAVIHCAAVLRGDFYDQFEGSVIASENLVEALDDRDGSLRFVHVSTFSVYGFLQRLAYTVLDETAPLERHMSERDNYARTKQIQEDLLRDAAQRRGWEFVTIRPGVIYGPGNWFPAQLGLQASEKTWVRMGSLAPVPSIYVENCADAIVLAAERREAAGQIYNIVDNNLPTQRGFMNRLRARLSPRPRVIPVPWWFMRLLGRTAWLFNRLALGGRAKLPGLLVPAQLHVRFKPFFYSNRKARDELRWVPRYSLEEALDRTFSKTGAREAQT